MPFCFSPWTNLDISPRGQMGPCCKFRHENYDQKFPNITSGSINDYVTSDLLSAIKNDFANDRWPRGCERCKIEEDNGIESKRQLDYQRWKHWYDSHDIHNDGWISASLAFGNTCNLTCITCGPFASSRWQKEHREIYGVDIKPLHFYKQDFVQNFMQQTQGLKHLDIPGGEPFLSGITEQMDLLQRLVDSGQSQQVSLHYTTNATVFPDQAWWDLWQHFHEIDLQLSIDGVGGRYEYLRFPADWCTLVKNVDRYQHKEHQLSNVRLSISHTISAYNIYYLDEFFTWCYNKALPRPWLGRVHTPDHMRPTVWPPAARQHIIQHLRSSSDPDVVQWANLVEAGDDSVLFGKFVDQLHLHDQYRGLNFSATFPEMAAFI